MRYIFLASLFFATTASAQHSHVDAVKLAFQVGTYLDSDIGKVDNILQRSGYEFVSDDDDLYAYVRLNARGVPTKDMIFIDLRYDRSTVLLPFHDREERFFEHRVRQLLDATGFVHEVQEDSVPKGYKLFSVPYGVISNLGEEGLAYTAIVQYLDNGLRIFSAPHQDEQFDWDVSLGIIFDLAAERVSNR